jgi:8-oxo-dGTP pyrophosphatase MutT (NUDIX family)
MIQGVQIIIANSNLELLIAKRSPIKSDGSPRIGANRWNFFGGKIDKYEKPIDAAYRELKEEAGLVSNLIFVSSKINEWDLNYDPFYAYLFFGFINHKDVILNDEHTEYKFISLKELDEYDIIGYSKKEILQTLSRIL